MKKLFAIFAMVGILTFGYTSYAQDAVEDQPTQTEQAAEPAAVAEEVTAAAPVVEEQSFTQTLKVKFIEGDVMWMTPVLLCLILGLAFSIERVLYLSLSQTDTKKLLNKVSDALKKGGISEAQKLCQNERGPVASIFYQGLSRYDQGLEDVEKSITSYGGVAMGKLEKGLSWIALFIALAPMLGFLGTVIGMVQAFDMIEAAGDISPTVVAGGIKVALLTTLFGLIVAIILQIFYNFCLEKIASIVNDMEDSSISFMDLLIDYKK
ncbi:MAG: MotA/TolQ/ExbB proton channel family protein [Bacteroidales bacterium]|nr:MotA/TolQ/ExbB proton channel family protein [Bacteroidales bacterium]